MPDDEEQDPDVLRVADEIVRYLQSREQVADTLDGIAEWWLLRQRLREERQRVKKAMDYLCEQGLITQRQLPDGTVIYVSQQSTNNQSQH